MAKIIITAAKLMLYLACLDFCVHVISRSVTTNTASPWATRMPSVVAQAISDNFIMRIPTLIRDSVTALGKAVTKAVIAVCDAILTIAWSVLPGLDNTPQPKFSTLL